MAKSVKRLPTGCQFAAVTCAAALALAVATVPVRADEKRLHYFDIKPQSLQEALLEYSEQAGVQLIIAANVRGLRLAAALEGNLELIDALNRLIVGTDLEFQFTSETTVTIRNKPPLPEPTTVAVEKPSERPTENTVEESGIEEVISVGTRAKGRTATQTPVPIDTVSSAALSATGHTEVGRMLQTLAPSFNFSSSSVSDGTDALRPATLRGLGPDQTLVLVNGKRRHTSALVHVNTSVGRGASGVDMNAVPASALGRIEVLRDGAAAQYGSDAIAGVVNLVLKNSREGGEVAVSYGQTYEGDGGTTLASANLGLPVGDTGFFNITADHRERGSTNRAGLTGAVQYPLLATGGCNAKDNSGCDPREFTFNRRNFKIGDAESESSALVANAELPLTDELDFYFFGTYTKRDNQSAGFYRRANEYDRTVTELYPDGFLPLINTQIEDYSTSGGITWSGREGWQIDLSANHGANSFQFVISNSLNASLGEFSPTTADAGTLFFGQTSLNLDAVRSFDAENGELTVAFGTEYREERYKLTAGDRASYVDGGAFNHSCPGCDTSPVRYASGFQVFRGFSPESEVDARRHNKAVYLDIEGKIGEQLLVTGAARFENYSDFGSTITGKFSARYEIDSWLAIRSSVSSGFRAPSMQQKNFSSVSTQFVEVGGITVAQERGTFRNDSQLAQLAGVPTLEEETSFSIGAGFVATLKAFKLTADYYHIEIDDRIGISSAVDLDLLDVAIQANTGRSGQFFINAADTVTDGLDVVATYAVPIGNQQKLKLSVAGNWTNTQVKQSSVARSIGGVDVGPLITRQDTSIIEDWQPQSRLNISGDYENGNWSVIGRLSQYGKYKVCEGACDGPSNIQRFSTKWLADMQISYQLEDTGLRFTLGVNNLFDTKPDANQIGQARAGDILGIVSSEGVFRYSRRSAPFGINGGYWYARTSYRF